MNIRLYLIEAITKNLRAIRAYEKAGLKVTNKFIKNGVEWHRMELKK